MVWEEETEGLGIPDAEEQEEDGQYSFWVERRSRTRFDNLTADISNIFFQPVRNIKIIMTTVCH